MVLFKVMFIDYLEDDSWERDVKGMKKKANLLRKTLEGSFSIENAEIKERGDKGREYFMLFFNAEDKFIKKIFKYCKNAGVYNIRTDWTIDKDS